MFFFFKLSFIMGIVTHSYLCLKKTGRWTLVLLKQSGTAG